MVIGLKTSSPATEITNRSTKLTKEICEFWNHLQPVFYTKASQNCGTMSDDECWNDLRLNLYALNDWSRRMRLALDFGEKLMQEKSKIYANRTIAKWNKSGRWKKEKNRLIEAFSASRAVWMRERGIEHKPIEHFNARKAVMNAWRSIRHSPAAAAGGGDNTKKRKRKGTVFSFLK